MSLFTESPSLLYRLTSIVERLDWIRIFATSNPVEVELGSGDGSFLVNCAAMYPERNFLGVERLLGRIRKLDRKGRRAGLKNLRGLRVECAYLLEYLLPPASVSALHVYFPDPWPKKKHHARRLINERFPALARNALTPDGIIYLRTDHAEYFDQVNSVFACSDFERTETPTELTHLKTDFESDFLAKGIQTFRTAFRRIKPPSEGETSCQSS